MYYISYGKEVLSSSLQRTRVFKGCMCCFIASIKPQTAISQQSARINSIIPQNILSHTMTTRSVRSTVVNAQLCTMWICTFPCAAQLCSTSIALPSGQVTATAVLLKISQFLCHFFLVKNVVQTKLLISSSFVNTTLLGYIIQLYIYVGYIQHQTFKLFHTVLPTTPDFSDPVSSPLFTFSELLRFPKFCASLHLILISFILCAESLI